MALAVLLAVGLGSAALDDDAGVARWLHLRGELAEARERVAALRAETEALRLEAERLEHGDFALERAIREELQLARPGQTLLRLPGQTPLRRSRRGVPSARIP